MTVPSITYRLATADDLDVLAALRWDMDVELRGAPADAASRDAFLSVYRESRRAGLEHGTTLVWVAEEEGQAVATAQLIWWPAPTVHEPHRKRGYVTGVYTQPAYRGRGIARHLMELIIERARQHGITRVMLYPSYMAVPLYQGLGFVPSRGLELNL
jgi:GNAT superfamily N-acetyltransferase